MTDRERRASDVIAQMDAALRGMSKAIEELRAFADEVRRQEASLEEKVRDE